MAHIVVVADDDAMRFVHDLTRDNMAPYYATYGRRWDTTLFDASWPQTENYCVLEDGARVGVLRIAQEEKTLWFAMCRSWRRGKAVVQVRSRCALLEISQLNGE
jgi:hypothetical protein